MIEYLRKAIELMNWKTEKQEQEIKLKNASLLARKESMEINAEFSEVEHDPEF